MKKTELIIGTSEFGIDGYADLPRIPDMEIIRILNKAWENGVRMLDCADTYGTDHIQGLFSGFECLNKTRRLPLLSKLYFHYKPGEAPIFVELASVYDPEQIPGLKKAVVPMSLNDTRFCNVKHLEKIYARSVFDRGRLLESGYTIKDCLSFVMRQDVDGIIVGVRSVTELEQVLKSWRELQ